MRRQVEPRFLEAWGRSAAPRAPRAPPRRCAAAGGTPRRARAGSTDRSDGAPRRRAARESRGRRALLRSRLAPRRNASAPCAPSSSGRRAAFGCEVAQPVELRAEREPARPSEASCGHGRDPLRKRSEQPKQERALAPSVERRFTRRRRPSGWPAGFSRPCARPPPAPRSARDAELRERPGRQRGRAPAAAGEPGRLRPRAAAATPRAAGSTIVEPGAGAPARNAFPPPAACAAAAPRRLAARRRASSRARARRRSVVLATPNSKSAAPASPRVRSRAAPRRERRNARHRAGAPAACRPPAAADLVLVEEEAHALRERERRVERDVEGGVAVSRSSVESRARLRAARASARRPSRLDPPALGWIRIASAGRPDREIGGRDDRRVERGAQRAHAGPETWSGRGAREEHARTFGPAAGKLEVSASQARAQTAPRRWPFSGGVEPTRRRYRPFPGLGPGYDPRRLEALAGHPVAPTPPFGEKGRRAETKKQVEELERVAIRFAGDSGDGMQLTGTKFTEATALAGNDLSTFPDFPAEIRAPAGSLAGVSGFQIHFAASRRPHAGRPARRARRAEPGRAARERRRRAPRRHGHPQQRRVHHEEPRARRLRRGSAAGAARALPRGRGPAHDAEPRGARRTSKLGTREADRSKNFFALGLMYWLYGRPMEPTLRWLEARFKGEVLRGEHPRAEGGLRTSARRPSCSRSPTSCRGRRSSRASTGTSPATRRSRGASSRRAQRLGAAGLPRRLPDHAGERRAARARALPPLRREDASRPRTRSPRLGVAIGASFAGHLAHLHDERPGLRAEAGGARPRRDGRAAARRRRHPARRPVDGHADEDRAGRPPARALRPQLRQPGRRSSRPRRPATASTS